MRYINQEQFTNIGGDLILVDTPQGTASDPQSITFTCAPPNCTPHSPGRSHHCSHIHFCTPTEIQTSSFNLHATASNFQRKLHARHTTHTTLSIAVGHARTMNGMCADLGYTKRDPKIELQLACNNIKLASCSKSCTHVARHTLQPCSCFWRWWWRHGLEVCKESARCNWQVGVLNGEGCGHGEGDLVHACGLHCVGLMLICRHGKVVAQLGLGLLCHACVELVLVAE